MELENEKTLPRTINRVLVHNKVCEVVRRYQGINHPMLELSPAPFKGPYGHLVVAKMCKPI